MPSRRSEASIAWRTCLRERPRWFGSGPIGLKTLVAITTRSRPGPNSLSARPSTSSLRPSEYMSAVSKKLMPSSSACRMNGSDASSSSTQSRQPGSPYDMQPRQIRETLRPVEPRLTWSILADSCVAGGVRRTGTT